MGSPIDPYHPLLTTPFIITNESELPLYDIKFAWTMKGEFFVRGPFDLRRKKFVGGPQPHRVAAIETKTSRISISKLQSSEKASVFIFMPITITKPLTYADLTVEISYKPKLWFWRQEKKFRFITKTNNKRQLIWLPVAISQKF